MSWLRLALLLFCLPAGSIYAQKHSQEFQLDPPKKPVSNSLYSRIQLLDLRNDTTNLGIVYTGSFNHPEKLVPNPALRIQVSTLLGQLIDSTTAQGGELLLRLQQFRFSEFKNTHPKVGYCQLSAELLVKTSGGYQLLNTLDTTLEIAQKSDVTAEILQGGSTCLTVFLSENLTRSAGGQVYSYQEVINLDSLRKRSLFVYNTDTFTNGLYRSYDAFVAQKPDAQVTAEVKNEHLRRVWTLNANGEKEERPDKEAIYGVVVNGKPYIATGFGYYLLKKQNDDFVYNGRMLVDSDGGAAGSAVMYGAAGYLLTKAFSGKPSEFFKIKINYRNGRPVPIRMYEF